MLRSCDFEALRTDERVGSNWHTHFYKHCVFYLQNCKMALEVFFVAFLKHVFKIYCDGKISNTINLYIFPFFSKKNQAGNTISFPITPPPPPPPFFFPKTLEGQAGQQSFNYCLQRLWLGLIEKQPVRPAGQKAPPHTMGSGCRDGDESLTASRNNLVLARNKGRTGGRKEREGG